MRKLKLNVDALQVESFEPSKANGGAGTVRGYLSAYYQLCDAGDTWQQTCTCEPTCNEQTCYNCGSAACPSVGCPGTGATCSCGCAQISATCPSPGYCG